MVAACVVGVEIVKRCGQQLGLGSAVLDWVVVDELFKKSNSKRLRIELLIHVLIAEQSTTMAARSKQLVKVFAKAARLVIVAFHSVK
jgi:hypothetical protein